MLSIATWNMQGAGKDKLEQLLSCSNVPKYDVLLLQEVGTAFEEGKKYSEGHYQCTNYSLDPKVEEKRKLNIRTNARCSTAILVYNKSLKIKDSFEIGNLNEKDRIIEGITVNYNNKEIDILTSHLTANQFYALKQIEYGCKTFNAVCGDYWIWGGDFNYDLQKKLLTDYSLDGAHMVFARQKTQGRLDGKKGELDYFIVSEKFYNDFTMTINGPYIILNLTGKGQQTFTNYSDHSIVGLQIDSKPYYLK